MIRNRISLATVKFNGRTTAHPIGQPVNRPPVTAADIRRHNGQRIIIEPVSF